MDGVTKFGTLLLLLLLLLLLSARTPGGGSAIPYVKTNVLQTHLMSRVCSLRAKVGLSTFVLDYSPQEQPGWEIADIALHSSVLKLGPAMSGRISVTMNAEPGVMAELGRDPRVVRKKWNYKKRALADEFIQHPPILWALQITENALFDDGHLGKHGVGQYMSHVPRYYGTDSFSENIICGEMSGRKGYERRTAASGGTERGIVTARCGRNCMTDCVMGSVVLQWWRLQWSALP
ncbi:uncharacterized protein B0H18DRAFT_957002 [Fomitopsis serialis]|uniref:uncharacterized protein n=1 Tax=Fomitopsis serialis TaxID=139415 RepID=UPI0020088053|nr:uncharacterized protein B0H18DRAFT_957002 [Neoantrodia serialis]KAH9920621.1 hypothetical protein B0H18DRAFT_957002 [Neoantrodia serialis]